MGTTLAKRGRRAQVSALTGLRIVSGGQTGVDRGALSAALAAGVECGGWCPAGRVAEDGVIPENFPVQELAGGGYRDRTRKNVLDSDATLVLINGQLEGGTAMTVADCQDNDKPVLTLDARHVTQDAAAVKAMEFVHAHKVETLNLAGPRASKWPAAEVFSSAVVSQLIELVKKPKRG